jgi:hypothetical protein
MSLTGLTGSPLRNFLRKIYKEQGHTRETLEQFKEYMADVKENNKALWQVCAIDHFTNRCTDIS